MKLGGPSLEADETPLPCEEADLIRECQRGNTAAYGPLVTLYQDRVFNLCWRMCGNRSDAEDLTQEAFIKAFEALGRFDGRSRFYTWLFRIAVNLVISARRKDKRARVFSIDARVSDDDENGAPTHAERLASDDPSPDQQAVDREQQRFVLEALASLDDEQRSVVTLRDLESFSYDEIAEILEVPTGTVKSRLHRARLALSEKLSPILKGI